MKTAYIIAVVLLILVIVIGLVMARSASKKSAGESSVTGGGEFTLLPSMPGPHAHTATLDEDLSGVSSEDMGHTHDVVNSIVAESGSTPHTHDLAERDTRGGAPRGGAPRGDAKHVEGGSKKSKSGAKSSAKSGKKAKGGDGNVDGPVDITEYL